MNTIELLNVWTSTSFYPVRMSMPNRPVVTFWVKAETLFCGLPEICYFDLKNAVVAIGEDWIGGHDPEENYVDEFGNVGTLPKLTTAKGDEVFWAAMILDPCYCSFVSVTD